MDHFLCVHINNQRQKKGKEKMIQSQTFVLMSFYIKDNIVRQFYVHIIT